MNWETFRRPKSRQGRVSPITRPTDDKVRKAFGPTNDIATISTVGAAASLGCSPPTARSWAAALGIRPRRRIGKKGPQSARIAPYRRRILVERLASIDGRLLKIQAELDGTPDEATMNETSGDWISDARINVQSAMSALESEPLE